jgi:hypothetical protein
MPYKIVLHIRLIEYFIRTANKVELLFLVINCRKCTYCCLHILFLVLFAAFILYGFILVVFCWNIAPKEYVRKDQRQVMHLQTRSVLKKKLFKMTYCKKWHQSKRQSYHRRNVQAVQEALHLRNFSMGKTFFARKRSEYKT